MSPQIAPFLFSGTGRVTMKEMWLFAVFAVAIGMTAGVVDVETELVDEYSQGPGLISLIAKLAMAWPTFAVSAKRYHDRGMSGWWPLWFSIIIVVPLFLLFGIPAEWPGPLVGGLPLSAWVPLSISAIALLTQFVILFVLPGTKGPNRYGADPRAVKI